jgi:hypothetical protein
MDDDILEAAEDTISIAKRMGSYLVSRASTDELKEIGQQVVLRADRLSEKLQMKRALPHIEVSNIPRPPAQNSTTSHITNSQPTAISNGLPHIEVSNIPQPPPTEASNVLPHIEVSNIPQPPAASDTIQHIQSSNKIEPKLFMPVLKSSKRIRNLTKKSKKIMKNANYAASLVPNINIPPNVNANVFYKTAFVPNVAAAAGGARRRTRRTR